MRTEGMASVAPGSRWDAFPRILRKRNVILLAEESFRYDLANAEVSPRTLAWLQERPTCFRSEIHYAGCHVSELGYFSLLYGLEPLHYSVFATERVPSYPLQVFRQNGYHLIIIAASLMWAFPNANVIENFHLVESLEHNGLIFRSLRRFLEEVSASKTPFFLYLNPHMAEEEAAGLVNRNNRTLVWRDLHDRDRMAIFRMLDEFGMLDSSLLFLTADHGDMKAYDNRGEVGHGQPESSWWQPKVSVPLWMCLPTTAGPTGEGAAGGVVAPEYDVRRKVGPGYTAAYQPPDLAALKDALPTATAHVDVLPTALSVLGLDPPVDPALFSSGRVLRVTEGVARDGHAVLQPATPREYVLFSPRFFPQRDKIIGIATRGVKLWFRVHRDEGSTAVSILPERLMDIADLVSYCASPAELRAAFGSQLPAGSKACVPPPPPALKGSAGPGPDSCVVRVAVVCPSVVAFLHRDMWRFLSPVPEQD